MLAERYWIPVEKVRQLEVILNEKNIDALLVFSREQSDPTLPFLIGDDAVHLAAALTLPAARICGAAVLCAMALRMVRAVPPAPGFSSGRLEGDLFVEGVLIGFLSPQTAALYAVALVGLVLETQALGNGLLVVALATIITVAWHAVVAALFSHPIMRAAALRHHRAICWTSAITLCSMAFYSTLSVQIE